MKPDVLVAVEDPGAANALAPVVAALRREDRMDVCWICHPYAQPAFVSFGLPMGDGESITPAVIERRFATRPPRLVLIGTAENVQSIDRVCLLQARRLGIPSLCLLDYWSQYTERFSGATAGERLAYLPDRICVMDQAANDALVAVGIPAHRLIVTGHPYLETYVQRLPPFPPAARARYLQGLGLAPDRRIVTFVSETFGWSYDPSYQFPPRSTSRERTVIILEHVLAVLSDLVRERGLRIAVVNKLHPKNTLEEFEWLDRRLWPFPVRSLTATDNPSLLRASSLVIGMTSMLLVEAACVGVPSLSVVPRAAEEQLGPGGAQICDVARNPEELRETVARLLVVERGGWAPNTPPLSVLHAGATARVVRSLYGLLGLLEEPSRAMVSEAAQTDG